jgi:hypothetical protein
VQKINIPLEVNFRELELEESWEIYSNSLKLMLSHPTGIREVRHISRTRFYDFTWNNAGSYASELIAWEIAKMKVCLQIKCMARGWTVIND